MEENYTLEHKDFIFLWYQSERIDGVIEALEKEENVKAAIEILRRVKNELVEFADKKAGI